jgi:hypothetical protein
VVRNEELYQLTTTYACGGLVVIDGVVVDACPIYRRFAGHTLEDVRNWAHDTGVYVSLKCVTERKDPNPSESGWAIVRKE